MIPGSANTLLLTSAAAAGGYQVERSIRLNAPDSAYFSRTPASAGNRKTWTWSGWVKRSVLSDRQYLFEAYDGSSGSRELIAFENDTLQVYFGSASGVALSTNALFRDPSAWYHIAWSVDTTQAVSTNRCKIYVNGVEQVLSGSYPAQNSDLSINSTIAHRIGTFGATSFFFSGYLADIYFIDGAALTPSSFGETDADGVWQPKTPTGLTYGTNGFHLDFADNSSAAALGYDEAGSNDWTVNNLSVTAGAGNDSLRDSPTNGTQTDTGIGGEVVGNYAVINPLIPSTTILSDGNLKMTGPNDGSGTIPRRATINLPSGKWYWEHTVTTASNAPANWSFAVGVSTEAEAGTNPTSTATSTRWAYRADFALNDVVQVAYDAATGKLWFGVNNTWISSGNPSTGANPYHTVSTTDLVFPFLWLRDNPAWAVNFGQRAFAYTAPSGFKALCTANLPAPTITKGSSAMDVVLWTGNGSTQSITSLAFNPDFVWIKSRSAAGSHNLFDAVRGATNLLETQNTDAETTNATATLTAFNGTGFSLSSSTRVNGSSTTYAGCCWDAGTSNATNTSGSITSTVRANISAGFSVVTWTATGGNATVGHGLGVAPQFILCKRRDGSTNWQVGHTSIGWTHRIYLNLTSASEQSTSAWDNTAPTSSVFSVGATGLLAGNIVSYCWAPVAGYSAFGSYTGNGDPSKNGPFIYTGFRPRWIMIKNITFSSAYTSWLIQDTARSAYNVMPDTNILWANLSINEGYRGNGISLSAYNKIDAVSNGFKIREESTHELNDASATYIYAAFAENPFKIARAR